MSRAKSRRAAAAQMGMSLADYMALVRIESGLVATYHEPRRRPRGSEQRGDNDDDPGNDDIERAIEAMQTNLE